jgi:hypothetical protein
MKKKKITVPSDTIWVIPYSRYNYYRALGMSNKQMLIINNNALLHITKGTVDKAIKFAHNNPKIKLKVVSFGKPEDIGPMFAFAPKNMQLPSIWKDHVGWCEGREYWG